MKNMRTAHLNRNPVYVFLKLSFRWAFYLRLSRSQGRPISALPLPLPLYGSHLLGDLFTKFKPIHHWRRVCAQFLGHTRLIVTESNLWAVLKRRTFMNPSISRNLMKRFRREKLRETSGGVPFLHKTRHLNGSTRQENWVKKKRWVLIRKGCHFKSFKNWKWKPSRKWWRRGRSLQSSKVGLRQSKRSGLYKDEGRERRHPKYNSSPCKASVHLTGLITLSLSP